LPKPDARRPVVGFARDHRRGEVVDWHHHDHAQLVYAASGLMRVDTLRGVWVVPPQRAVWVPAGIEHRIRHITATEWRSLYVVEGQPGLPDDLRVIAVSPLLRELIRTVTGLPADYPAEGPEARLIAVLLDLLRAPALPELHLPLPRDRRLQVVSESLLENPGDPRCLDDWARQAGASARTLARLFVAETGLGFQEWRRQLRLHAALARLAGGEPVTSVAYAVGYDSPSAFIAMFRKATGESPGHFLKRRRLPGR
jgi:AraC-like DNA-binding protein